MLLEALKFQACIPARYWAECVESALYLLNRLTTEVLKGHSPYELMHQKVPSLSRLRAFRCLCYATNLVRSDKYDVRAKRAIPMGYSSNQKGYKLLDCSTNRFFVSRDVVFKEHLFPFSSVGFPSSTPSLARVSTPLDDQVDSVEGCAGCADNQTASTELQEHAYIIIEEDKMPLNMNMKMSL